jgi:hypothetical protein
MRRNDVDECAVVREIRHLGGFRLELVFDDGLRGTVDFAQHIAGRGGVFEALRNPDYFAKVRVDAELGTIVWPNGADFCPDVLYEWTKGKVFESAK